MKLSSRKKLLKESDIILNEIRKNIFQQKLNEDINVKEFFNKLVTSITDIIVTGYKKGRQYYYYQRIPYLIGLDLINKEYLNIDISTLNILNGLMSDIIKDVKSSNELKDAIRKLKDADVSVGVYQSEIYANGGGILPRKLPSVLPKDYNRLIEPKRLGNSRSDWLKYYTYKYYQAMEDYNDILKTKITSIVADILRRDKYKNFTEMITNTLKRGISGFSNEEMEEIQKKYINIIINRVSKYINTKKIDHYVGSSISRSGLPSE